MYNGEQQRTRCHICTGCGHCGIDKMHILTIGAAGDSLPLKSISGERLVTVDVGTTTIAMQLYDENGKVVGEHVEVNPQTVFGADVLSRIQAAQDSAKAKEMQKMAETVLSRGIAHFQKSIKPGEKFRMVLAANTTMVYLLMGWKPLELGKTPFLARHLDAVQTKIAGVSCYIFPGLSAFVGGDIVAGILACGMTEREEITLLIDLGTNGEMVLGNCDKLLACATAAGPAFEGGVNRGVWGADMVGILARLRREGILDETGLLADPYFETGVRIGDVCVTQEAVRAIQLAKGAINAGIHILMNQYGIDAEKIDRVVLAGGFGYYLKPQEAAQIGLLPRTLVHKAISGGNSVLTGALSMGRTLLEEHPQIWDVYNGGNRMVKILNLAEQKEFEQVYIDSLNLIEN